MILRDATDDDLEAVLAMAREFCAHAGENYHREHTIANITGIRQGGFLLVVENGGNVVGMLAAVAAPGLCSPGLRMHEVCLWVTPGHREGHALLLLLREFDRRAVASGATSAQLSSLATSPPSLTRVYNRMGYTPADSSFVRIFGSN